MNTTDYYFDLPESLIAKYPSEKRDESRLMLLDRSSGRRGHFLVKDLPAILAGPEFRGGEGLAPLLVFNNSRVRKARLKAFPAAASGVKTNARGNAFGNPEGETEFLLLNRVNRHTWQTLVNRSKRRRPGSRYFFEGGVEGEIVQPPEAPANNAGIRYIRFSLPIDDDWLDIHGHVPLPPYIKRKDESSDDDRYQTIYADKTAASDLGPGASAAAPTAGLHFTKELFARLDEAGIERVFITLHVGMGTFLPVRTERLEDHVMHEELFSISEETARRINDAKAAGRKVIAVGTTAVRALESACYGENEDGQKTFVKAGEANTRIFIYPGYVFKIIDALFTNFHTPQSTLLMLVAAFAEEKAGCGRNLILESYAEAIKEGYRFFSYGDAMLIR